MVGLRRCGCLASAVVASLAVCSMAVGVSGLFGRVPVAVVASHAALWCGGFGRWRLAKTRRMLPSQVAIGGNIIK